MKSLTQLPVLFESVVEHILRSGALRSESGATRAQTINRSVSESVEESMCFIDVLVRDSQSVSKALPNILLVTISQYNTDLCPNARRVT